MYQPQNLAKDYSKWCTIAIELSSTDYDLLSSPSFWDSGIRFQDYVGYVSGGIMHLIWVQMIEKTVCVNNGYDGYCWKKNIQEKPYLLLCKFS